MGITSFADLHNADGLLAKYLLACHDLDELLGGIVILFSASFSLSLYWGCGRVGGGGWGGRISEFDTIFIQH